MSPTDLAHGTPSPGWYPDPTPATLEFPWLRYWDGGAWTAEVRAIVPERVEPMALLIAIVPLIGLLGGLLVVARPGKRLTGLLMMAVGAASWVVIQAVLSAVSR